MLVIYIDGTPRTQIVLRAGPGFQNCTPQRLRLAGAVVLAGEKGRGRAAGAVERVRVRLRLWILPGQLYSTDDSSVKFLFENKSSNPVKV